MITQQHSEQVLQWLRATVALNHVALNISVIELSGRGNKRCWPPDVEVLKRFLIVVCFHPLQFIKFIKISCRWQAGVIHHGARWSYVIRCFWRQRFVALDHLFFFKKCGTLLHTFCVFSSAAVSAADSSMQSATLQILKPQPAFAKPPLRLFVLILVTRRRLCHHPYSLCCNISGFRFRFCRGIFNSQIESIQKDKCRRLKTQR